MISVPVLEKIVSGGQTGVDRAALDVAMLYGIPQGGYCPKGRKAEDGPIPQRYHLSEMPTDDYYSRTRKNVEISDGTLILARGELVGGTAYTAEFSQALGKKILIIEVDLAVSKQIFEAWLSKNNIRILNIAGPRESKQPGIYKKAREVLEELLRRDGRLRFGS
jgi:hypothetical protein